MTMRRGKEGRQADKIRIGEGRRRGRRSYLFAATTTTTVVVGGRRGSVEGNVGFFSQSIGRSRTGFW